MCAKTWSGRASSEVTVRCGIAVGHNIRPVEVAHKAVLEEMRVIFPNHLGEWKGGEERGREGVWNPKICAPKMAHNNFSHCKSHFFPLQIWDQGPGGPSSYGCQPF